MVACSPSAFGEGEGGCGEDSGGDQQLASGRSAQPSREEASGGQQQVLATTGYTDEPVIGVGVAVPHEAGEHDHRCLGEWARRKCCIVRAISCLGRGRIDAGPRRVAVGRALALPTSRRAASASNRPAATADLAGRRASTDEADTVWRFEPDGALVADRRMVASSASVTGSSV